MSQTPTSENKLIFRYTKLEYLLEMLEKQIITFLSPISWDDKNDACFLLNSYKSCPKSSTLALCFTDAPDTFHHWSIFAGGKNGDGVRIEFDRDELIEHLTNLPPSKALKSLKSVKVRYLRIEDLKKGKFTPEELPFLKRLPYEDESEFRIICEGSPEDGLCKSVPFNPQLIRRITLSPWMSYAEKKKTAINEIPECEKIPVCNSTLTDNKQWLKALVSKQKQ